MVERLLKEEEAAALLGMTAAALRTRRCRGGGPDFCRIGRSIRYRIEDIRSYIDGKIRQPGLMEIPTIPEPFRLRAPKRKRIAQ